MNPVKGTAIYIPVCSPKHCCKPGGKIHHLTLTHLGTTDKRVVDLAMDCIREYIQISEFLKDSPNGKLVGYTFGKEGPNSTILEGEVEAFKQGLDSYLRSEPGLSKLISSYRPAHVDRFSREVKYYSSFRVEDLRTM